MAFDLHFCASADGPEKIAAVGAWLAACRSVRPAHRSDSHEWRYENPDTGVYFKIRLAPPAGEAGPRMGLPPLLKSAGATLSLNYARPSFFGREAFTIATQLAADLQLSIFDPQAASRGEDGLAVGVYALLKSWGVGNRAAVDVLRRYRWEGGPLCAPICPVAAAEWHTYQYHRTAIEAALRCETPELQAPPLLLVSDRTRGNRVQRVAVWTVARPLALPACDILLLQHKATRFWSGATLELHRAAPAADVRAELGRLWRHSHRHGVDLDYLTAPLPEATQQRVARLGRDIPAERFCPVAFENIVEDEPAGDDGAWMETRV